jgi:hypothetical protein
MNRLDLIGSGVVLGWLALALLFKAAAGRAEHGPAGTYRRLIAVLLLASTCLCLPWLREHLPRRVTGFAPLTFDIQVLAGIHESPAPFGRGRGLVLSPFAIVAVLWVVALLGGTLRRAAAWARLNGLLARCTPAPAVLQVVMLQLARTRGLKEPRLLLSSEARSPFSYGWLTPVVVLPQEMVEELTSEQLHLVLLHELSHLRRRDPLTHGLARLCATLFPLHPSLPSLMRELVFAREAAVDAEVAPNDPHGYASLLVELAARARFGAADVAPVAMDDTALSRRIALLTRTSAATSTRSSAALAVATALIVALGLLTPRVFAAPGLALAAPAAGMSHAFFAQHEDPMAAHVAEIDACYALARAADAELVIDTLARLDVDPKHDFRVVSAYIPAPSSPIFQSCLEEKALSWSFPPPPDIPPPPEDMPEDAKAIVQLNIQRAP